MRYEKPQLKFVSLQNEKAVANTCWGGHNKETTFYCDIEGKGFVSFQIAQGSCTLNLINVKYYGEDTNGDGKITVKDTSVDATEEQRKILNDILVNSGGSTGNNYNGEGTIVFPDRPDPSWS